MQTTHEQVTALVYAAVDEVNKDLTDEQQLIKAPATVLFGRDATIDSMALVSFIVAVEEQIHDQLGISLGRILRVQASWSETNSSYGTSSTVAAGNTVRQ